MEIKSFNEISERAVHPISPAHSAEQKQKNDGEAHREHSNESKESTVTVTDETERREFVSGYDKKGNAILRRLTEKQARDLGFSWESGKTFDV